MLVFPVLLGTVPPTLLFLSHIAQHTLAREPFLASPWASRARMYPLHILIEGVALAALFQAKAEASADPHHATAMIELVLVFYELAGLPGPRSHTCTLTLIALCWLAQLHPLVAFVVLLCVLKLFVTHSLYMRCRAGLSTYAESTATSLLFHSLFMLYYSSHICLLPNPYLPRYRLHPLIDGAVAWTAFLLQLMVTCCLDCRTRHEDRSDYREEGVPLVA
jgi:hypothetical protein